MQTDNGLEYLRSAHPAGAARVASRQIGVPSAVLGHTRLSTSPSRLQQAAPGHMRGVPLGHA